MKEFKTEVLLSSVFLLLINPAALVASDLSYTPVEPCRILDTRNSVEGDLQARVARSFFAYGTAAELADQGGLIDCPHPKEAEGIAPVAIAANVTAAGFFTTSPFGNIRAYPSGATPPDGSLVNFVQDTNIANSTIIKLCESGCARGDFDLLATATVPAIVDVQGYFYPKKVSEDHLCELMFRVFGPDLYPEACPKAENKIVFVTSTTYQGGLGGLEGADRICSSRAAAVGLPGDYRAWLSNSTVSVSERFARSSFDYILPDSQKTLVARGWSDLTDGKIQAPINVNELGEFVGPNAEVWTNTQLDGNAASASCADWTSYSTRGRGVVGAISASAITTGSWTNIEGVLRQCSMRNHLYCFQQ